MTIVAAIILVVALIAPSVAATLNFTRFYAITLLFLSPCFVLGGQAILVTIGKAWKKIKRPLKRQIGSKSKNIDVVLLVNCDRAKCIFSFAGGICKFCDGG